MVDSITVQWWWLLAGVIVGVAASWLVSDLVFPPRK